jgi:hypothetical protein
MTSLSFLRRTQAKQFNIDPSIENQTIGGWTVERMFRNTSVSTTAQFHQIDVLFTEEELVVKCEANTLLTKRIDEISDYIRSILHNTFKEQWNVGISDWIDAWLKINLVAVHRDINRNLIRNEDGDECKIGLVIDPLVKFNLILTTTSVEDHQRHTGINVTVPKTKSVLH